MVLAPWVVYALYALVAIAAIYSYYTFKKSQKGNTPKASQLDGTICDEGQSFSDIAGSPHLHGFITWKGNESTDPIKKKQGK